MHDVMTAADFADACARAAVRLRVLGKDGRARPIPEWRRLFLGELSAELARRAAASAKDAAAPQKELLKGSCPSRQLGGGR